MTSLNDTASYDKVIDFFSYEQYNSILIPYIQIYIPYIQNLTSAGYEGVNKRWFLL